jgi:hypothetical protein
VRSCVTAHASYRADFAGPNVHWLTLHQKQTTERHCVIQLAAWQLHDPNTHLQNARRKKLYDIITAERFQGFTQFLCEGRCQTFQTTATNITITARQDAACAYMVQLAEMLGDLMSRLQWNMRGLEAF